MSRDDLVAAIDAAARQQVTDIFSRLCSQAIEEAEAIERFAKGVAWIAEVHRRAIERVSTLKLGDDRGAPAA